MTDKELLERLRAEVAAVTPDCWSGILARVQSPAQQPEEAPVVPMPERKRRSAWRGWVAAAAVFFLVILGGGLYATQVPGGVATLDANPSIELTVNKLGRVLSARACNPDAQLVLDGLELRNQSLQTAADAIVANMQADGYVSADANSILVTVEAGKGDARLCGRLADAVESAQTDCGMESAVLAQVLEDDPALEAYASAVGVSAGKAMLIRQISAQVQDLTGTDTDAHPDAGTGTDADADSDADAARRPGHAGAGAEDRHCGGWYLGERPGRVGCSARREWCAAGLPRDAYDGVLLPPPLRRGCRSADRNGALGGTVRIIQATKRTPGRASFFAARRYGASLCRWGRGMPDFSS